MQDGSIIEEDKMAPLNLLGAVVQSTLMAQKRGKTDSSLKEGRPGGGVKKEEDQEQSGEEPAGEGRVTTAQASKMVLTTFG